jgi:hypothetical protein
VWIRTILILACCLSLAGNVGGQQYDEVIPTPNASLAPMQSGPAASSHSTQSGPAITLPESDQVCEERPTPNPYPWYYWWSSWCWWDRAHDREQHQAYLPPVPGWYYFRPYSLGQLKAQQEMVAQWGGDPRNPYCTGILPQPATPRTGTTPAPTSASATGHETTRPIARIPMPAPDIVKWPPVLRDPCFADARARIEAPYRRGIKPTASNFRNMIETVGQMQADLTAMTRDPMSPEYLAARRFLDQLAAEARHDGNIQDPIPAVAIEKSPKTPRIALTAQRTDKTSGKKTDPVNRPDSRVDEKESIALTSAETSIPKTSPKLEEKRLQPVLTAETAPPSKKPVETNVEPKIEPEVKAAAKKAPAAPITLPPPPTMLSNDSIGISTNNNPPSPPAPLPKGEGRNLMPSHPKGEGRNHSSPFPKAEGRNDLTNIKPLADPLVEPAGLAIVNNSEPAETKVAPKPAMKLDAPGWASTSPDKADYPRIVETKIGTVSPDPALEKPAAAKKSAPSKPAATPVAMDIIQWPAALCEPRFADSRAAIEAPYRRKMDPTEKEYRNMIDAARRMKTLLGKPSEQLSAQERADAEKFLDRLSAEAKRFIQTLEQPTVETKRVSESPKQPTVETKRVSESPKQATVETKRVSESPKQPTVETKRITESPKQPTVETKRVSESPKQPTVETKRVSESPKQPTVETKRASESPKAIASSPPRHLPANTDIIKWPRILCDPCFASQRTRIEEPYRRKTDPTAEDFQNMVEAAGRMEVLLVGKMAEISAPEYLDTRRFLDRLIAEARRSGDVITKNNIHAADRPAVKKTAPKPSPEKAVVAASFETDKPEVVSMQVALDIIQWPKALCDRRFEAFRAKIEVPYRQKAAPTVSDYENIIDAAKRMETVLVGMMSEISAPDYVASRKFLDRMIAEAQDRIAKENESRPALAR